VPAIPSWLLEPLWDLCVPKTSSTSRDQAIFVDQATDARAFSCAVLVEVDRLWQRFQRGGCVQGPVRPVQIVMGLVLAQDPPVAAASVMLSPARHRPCDTQVKTDSGDLMGLVTVVGQHGETVAEAVAAMSRSMG
jgi:hypothetical protein